MTIDVHVPGVDEEFLDDIDEIMEDTMVQMFILHPKNSQELERAKEQADEHNQIFYCAPLTLASEADNNCVAFFLENKSLLKNNPNLEKALYIDAKNIDEELTDLLIQNNYRGIILNATETYDALKNFFISIGPKNIKKFKPEVLEKLPMSSIVLESGYPDFGFDEIFKNSKLISDIIFRPDPSIIAEATRNSLILFGFKKS